MTPEEVMVVLERRVNRIERRERWLARLCVALAAGLAFSLWSAQAYRREAGTKLQTRSLALMDPEGHPRILLTADSQEDGPMMEFLDADGKSRVQLLAEDRSIAALLLFDGHEKVRSVLSTLYQATAGLTLFDSKGTLQAGFQLSDGSDPGLFLYDRHGRNLFRESRMKPAVFSLPAH